MNLTAVDKAMAYAYAKLGDWYQWDGKGPNTFDCSGLTQDSWLAAGYNIGAGTSGQLATGTFILGVGSNQPWASTMWEFLRGDVLFPSAEHCQLYDGAGMIIEAPSTGLKVRRIPQWATSLYAVRRIVPGDPNAPLLWPGTILTIGVSYFGTGKWQQRMNALGMATPALKTDSSYGSLTAAATAKFQAGIPRLGVSGHVDGATWAAAFK